MQPGVPAGLVAPHGRAWAKHSTFGWFGVSGRENAQIGLAGIFTTGYVVYGGAVPGSVGSYANKHGNWL
jgi:hypothetical protein